jgi:hypothetical protein
MLVSWIRVASRAGGLHAIQVFVEHACNAGKEIEDTRATQTIKNFVGLAAVFHDTDRFQL